MSLVLYYSNYCEKCKSLLRIISKSDQKNDIHFLCIDKRFRNNDNGAIYIVLENQQKVLLPPQITKVPAMLLLNSGNKVIFGNEIDQLVGPKVEYSNAKSAGWNGEPEAYAFGSDNVGGFGVMSDSFSYWDQSSEEMLAKGNGGERQMYNYATVNTNSNIETPPDTWTPDKVGEDALKKMEAERNNDLRMQQLNKQNK